MIAAPTLALPAFRGIPLARTFRHGPDVRLVQLARILIEIGVVWPEDVGTGRARSEATILERALRRWAGTQTQGLRAIRHLSLVVNPDGVGELADYAGDARDLPDPDRSVVIGLGSPGYSGTWFLERRCSAIEREVRGLAQTALRWLTCGLLSTTWSYTPAQAAEHAEMLYGWNDEVGEEEQAVTEKTFAGTMPEWAYAPQASLGRARLRACRHPVAACVTELAEAITDRRFTQWDVGSLWHTGVAVMVRWNDKDRVTDIADHYLNDACNGGDCTDDFGHFPVPLENKAVATLFRQLEAGFRVVRAADRLLQQIADAR